MNSVVLVGRLTDEPEVRRGGDSVVARYRLAVDRRFRRDGADAADFIPVTVFGKGAEVAESYLHKGMKIGVTGRIQTGNYTNNEGRKVYTWDVIAESQEFMESKAQNQQAAASAPQATPAVAQTYQQPAQRTAPQTDANGFMQIPDSLGDELPFV